jgi:hypothetical protein
MICVESILSAKNITILCAQQKNMYFKIATMKKIFVLAIVFIGFAITTFAQTVANAGVTAIIETPSSGTKSIAYIADMDFGTITNNLASGSTGTLTLNPDGTITAIDPGLAQATHTGKPAQFLIKGATPGTMAITYPASLQLTGSGAPLTVTLTPDVVHNAACWEDVAGSTDQKLKMGGTLSIPSGAYGAYTSGSTLVVTVTHF